MVPSIGRVATVAALAPVTALLLVASTGSAVPPAGGLPDPGPVVRWGLPAVQALRDLAAVATVGLLVTAATLLPGPGVRRGAELTGLQRQAQRYGAAAAWLWVGLSVAGLLLSFADLAGLPVSAVEVWLGLPMFASEFESGRPLAVSAALALAVAVGAQVAVRPGGVGVAAALAVVAVLPLAWTGHAAGDADHTVAVDTQLFHLAGVTVWVGGLAAVAVLRRRLADDLPVVAGRFSTLAGWCYAAVGLSGLVGAAARLGSVADLTSSYGILLIGKAAALTLLGVAGWAHRRAVLPRLSAPGGGRLFARLVAAELSVMGLAVGAAVALSRTAPPPPAGGADVEVAEAMLGYPSPPPLTVETIFAEWRPDPLWLPVTALGLWWYLRGVRRLRRAGDRWPVGRTAAVLIGCVLLTVSTSGSPGVYGQVLFSIHMVQHMTLATAVPTFLVLAAPVTLALRTLPPRGDGSRGPREWLLAAVHSTPARLLSHPLVAAGLFIGSLVVFYYSGLFELSLATHAGHLVMTVHFLLAGYLFANVICGLDPGPTRPPHLFRLLLLIITFSFHAFFAVSLMSGGVLAPDWYRVVSGADDAALAADQALGAGLGWALGDYPIAILAAALLWSWYHSDNRAAARHDRQADRDQDAELGAYNQRLGRLNQGGRP